MQTRNFPAEIKKESIILIFVMISSRFEVKEVFTRQMTLTPITIQRATLAAPIVGSTISVWVIPTTINCCLILPTTCLIMFQILDRSGAIFCFKSNNFFQKSGVKKKQYRCSNLSSEILLLKE